MISIKTGRLLQQDWTALTVDVTDRAAGQTKVDIELDAFPSETGSLFRGLAASASRLNTSVERLIALVTKLDTSVRRLITSADRLIG